MQVHSNIVQLSRVGVIGGQHDASCGVGTVGISLHLWSEWTGQDRTRNRTAAWVRRLLVWLTRVLEMESGIVLVLVTVAVA